ILERAGTSDKGTITGIYTVLVEGDDVNEPVSDMVRAILDGHIVLSRKLSNRSHFPAIDILQSISRVQKDVIGEEHRQMVVKLIQMYADYTDAEDLINIGAYAKGSNPRIDRAISRIDAINAFLRQDIGEYTSSDDMFKRLGEAIGGVA
ncbi:MAG: EscN/YscN/HrcN family type III secretion system ATPase, partial [Candidatus Latescibacteria bacterium]|nr:EscN/YscN/HrcN family type III secretion system ATPase [Candidatus Latescibacterota bacterium]